jgi:hypothetical protein
MDTMTADTMAASSTVNNLIFNEDQIQHLSSLRFINRIDEHLNIVSGVKISTTTDNIPPRVLLLLDIYYDDKQLEKISFNLHNFDYEDIVYVARNIRSNEYILQAVDNLLSGDIE